MLSPIVELMTALFRASLTGQPLPPSLRSALTPSCPPTLYALTKAHDLSHLAADALETSGLASALPPETAAAFHSDLLRAVYRVGRMQYQLDVVSAAFEEARICFLPLKGSVLRSLYPEPWMRTGVDVDILVKPADLDAASALLLSLGYRRQGSSDHDVAFLSPDGVRLELHHRMLGHTRNTPAASVLDGIWAHVSPVSPGSYRQQLDQPTFLFLHIAHMAEHFEAGGCGLRPFLDLWLMKKHNLLGGEESEALLKKGGLLSFYRACLKLSAALMDGTPEKTKDEKELALFEEYILMGGVYGTAENMAAMGKAAKGRAKYFFSRLFVSYDRLKYIYPILQKHKLLFPAMQVRRWLEKLRKNGIKRYASEVKHGEDAPDRESMKELRSYLGL